MRLSSMRFHGRSGDPWFACGNSRLSAVLVDSGRLHEGEDAEDCDCRRWFRIGGVTILALIVASTAMWGYTVMGPRAKVGPTVADIGNVVRGAQVTATFTIMNEGRRDLIIENLSPACSMRTPILEGVAIPSGKSLQIPVTLDTALLPDGKTIVPMALETNDRANRHIKLGAKVNVVSEFRVSANVVYLRGAVPHAILEVVTTRQGNSTTSVTGVSTTDLRVFAELVRKPSDPSVTRVRISTLADADKHWDFGTIVIETSSKVRPKIVVPIRGGLFLGP